MKLITARIKPHRLDSVHTALVGVGIDDLIAIEVKGFDRDMDHTEIYRGRTYSIAFMPMIKIEIVVADEMVIKVVDTICEAANPNHNNIDGGKILVSEVLHTQTISADITEQPKGTSKNQFR